MKAIWILMGITLAAGAEAAVVSERTVTLPVNLSTTALKWSRSGYIAPVIKVFLPEVADVTILNHRNKGAEAPCLATFDASTPEEVIQNNPAIEQIPFTITLSRLAHEVDGRCVVQLDETIQGTIRGFSFAHSRQQTVEERELGDCR